MCQPLGRGTPLARCQPHKSVRLIAFISVLRRWFNALPQRQHHAQLDLLAAAQRSQTTRTRSTTAQHGLRAARLPAFFGQIYFRASCAKLAHDEFGPTWRCAFSTRGRRQFVGTPARWAHVCLCRSRKVRARRSWTAQVVVFEMADDSHQRFCVCNTHIHWDPNFLDVKLWQTHTLTTRAVHFGLPPRPAPRVVARVRHGPAAPVLLRRLPHPQQGAAVQLAGHLPRT